MNYNEQDSQAAKYRRTTIFATAAILIYAAYYFVLCHMQIIGTPTFRIDYFATTISRASDPLSRSLIHPRPISELYVYVQALAAKLLLNGQSRYIIYPVQHLTILIYFISIARVIESILNIRMSVLTFVAAWLLFIVNPGVLGNVYKLETIVGTLSMLFGGLALVHLTRWYTEGRARSAKLFFVFFALSIFSKEDFILPPLVYIAWQVVVSENWRAELSKRKTFILALMALLGFFLVFNKLLIPGRSYMDPVNKANAPYFMTLNPLSVLKVFLYYTVGLGLHIKSIGVVYAIASLAAIAFRTYWKATLLIAGIVASLMMPYLIMPNHIFSYYALNWWPWETLAAMALAQAIISNKTIAAVVASVASAIIVIPGLNGIYAHRSVNLSQANYLRDNFSKSRNLQATLRENRALLNQYPVIAVTGIGPGGVEQSPWQGNGETAFYLQKDLGLTPHWMLFVKSGDASYVIDRRTPDPASDLAEVDVRAIDDMKDYPNLPVLAFDKQGNGTLQLPPSQ